MIRGLTATRQLKSLSMDAQTFLFIEGTLPDMPEMAAASADGVEAKPAFMGRSAYRERMLNRGKEEEEKPEEGDPDRPSRAPFRPEATGLEVTGQEPGAPDSGDRTVLLHPSVLPRADRLRLRFAHGLPVVTAMDDRMVPAARSDRNPLVRNLSPQGRLAQERRGQAKIVLVVRGRLRRVPVVQAMASGPASNPEPALTRHDLRLKSRVPTSARAAVTVKTEALRGLHLVRVAQEVARAVPAAIRRGPSVHEQKAIVHGAVLEAAAQAVHIRRVRVEGRRFRIDPSLSAPSHLQTGPEALPIDLIQIVRVRIVQVRIVQGHSLTVSRSPAEAAMIPARTAAAPASCRVPAAERDAPQVTGRVLTALPVTVHRPAGRVRLVRMARVLTCRDLQAELAEERDRSLPGHVMERAGPRASLRASRPFPGAMPDLHAEAVTAAHPAVLTAVARAVVPAIPRIPTVPAVRPRQAGAS